MTITITSTELKSDCDAAYQQRFGQAENLNSLTGRLARGELSDDELKMAEGCQCVEQLHAKLYPEHVGLDEYRQAWFAAQKSAGGTPAEPAVDTPDTDTPDTDTPDTDTPDTDAGDVLDAE